MTTRSVFIIALAEENYSPQTLAHLQLFVKDKPDHTKLFIFSRKQLLHQKNPTIFNAAYHFFGSFWGRIRGYLFMGLIMIIQLPTYVITASDEDRSLFSPIAKGLSLITGHMEILPLEKVAATRDYSTLALYSDQADKLPETTASAKIPSLIESLRAFLTKAQTSAATVKKIQAYEAVIIPSFETRLVSLCYYLYVILLKKDLVLCLTEQRAYWIAAQKRLPFFWEIIHGLNPLTLIMMTIITRSFFIVPSYLAKVELVRSNIPEGLISVIPNLNSTAGQQKYRQLLKTMSWPLKARLL
jgi:hypothetical protein